METVFTVLTLHSRKGLNILPLALFSSACFNGNIYIHAFILVNFGQFPSQKKGHQNNLSTNKFNVTSLITKREVRVLSHLPEHFTSQ